MAAGLCAPAVPCDVVALSATACVDSAPPLLKAVPAVADAPGNDCAAALQAAVGPGESGVLPPRCCCDSGATAAEACEAAGVALDALPPLLAGTAGTAGSGGLGRRPAPSSSCLQSSEDAAAAADACA